VTADFIRSSVGVYDAIVFVYFDINLGIMKYNFSVASVDGIFREIDVK